MFKLKKKDVEDALAVAGADKSSAARIAARQYCDKLYSAIETLKEFNSKQIDSLEELQEMKNEFWRGGHSVTLVTTHNGLSALIDSDGNVLATYVRVVDLPESYEE